MSQTRTESLTDANGHYAGSITHNADGSASAVDCNGRPVGSYYNGSTMSYDSGYAGRGNHLAALAAERAREYKAKRG